MNRPHPGPLHRIVKVCSLGRQAQPSTINRFSLWEREREREKINLGYHYKYKTVGVGGWGGGVNMGESSLLGSRCCLLSQLILQPHGESFSLMTGLSPHWRAVWQILTWLVSFSKHTQTLDSSPRLVWPQTMHQSKSWTDMETCKQSVSRHRLPPVLLSA